MNKEEYAQRVTDIKNRAYEDTKRLAVEYVKENAEFRPGDIVTDGQTTIKIAGLHIQSGSIGNTSLPIFSYKGVELTKKLVPRKDGAIGYVFSDRARKV